MCACVYVITYTDSRCARSYDVDLAPGAQCLPFSAPTNTTVLGYAIMQGCLPMARWDALNEFVRATNASLVFGTCLDMVNQSSAEHF